MKIITIKTNPNVVRVDLTPEQVELFKYFMRHYDNIKILEDGGVFEIAGKTFTLHTDQGGRIRRIDTSLVTFNGK